MIVYVVNFIWDQIEIYFCLCFSEISENWARGGWVLSQLS